MKQILLLLLPFLFSACNKNSLTETDNTITGKWSEYENYISPGTPWYWQSSNNIEIQIKSDLSYTSNNDNYFWGRNGKIETLTDSTFLLKSPVFTSSRTCYYNVKDGVLEVWYPCIEGCGSRFKRKK
jgi:hypothetical protein